MISSKPQEIRPLMIKAIERSVGHNLDEEQITLRLVSGIRVWNRKWFLSSDLVTFQSRCSSQQQITNFEWSFFRIKTPNKPFHSETILHPKIKFSNKKIIQFSIIQAHKCNPFLNYKSTITQTNIPLFKQTWKVNQENKQHQVIS
jgi:hypothetical protein